ncbi:hypothetical protein SUGI_0082640 [Cryptomeria japonica]|uniref:protein ASPARTIC PROTEASE IN GUARD CELL 2 n=1 Tax=Cryptomeria japonica TaxID=3369 RepID=UPI00240893F0|nr:protein ASPARTIC PROTEASE IN GUARD CELL 2 [Cryptomeria japonica]GLJ08168.1 hypothetical protein SUGI_0082640 [Cryptomeria japonica]
MAAKTNFTAMLALYLLSLMFMAGAHARKVNKDSIFDVQAALRAARGGAAQRFEAKAVEEEELADQTLAVTLTPPLKEAAAEQQTLAVPLVHRDAVAGATNWTYEQRIKQMLKRDAARVAAIYDRLSNLTAKRPLMESGGVEIPVMSGKGEGSGEYFTRIGVGTPARQQLLVLDTGSDITWLQCQPCEDCYSQSDPIFNPAFSSSFNGVSCDSNLCRQLDQSGCSRQGNCQYQVSYGDGSYTVGSFDTETVTLGKTRVSNVAFGCGQDNEGLFVGASGLLGLGGGAFSLPSQLSHSNGNIFSYCLVYRDSSASSTLQFGREAVPREAVFVPLLKNSRINTFYYVSLAGISVGGNMLNIPESVFRIDATGNGGVILDSGTPVTRLQRGAYVALRDAFVAGMGNLQLSDGFVLFDTCYKFPNRVSVTVPSIAFHFSNGVSLPLPAKNYLVAVNSRKICLAFAPVSSGMSIIGSIQQQGIRVSFDPVNARVGFAVNKC